MQKKNKKNKTKETWVRPEPDMSGHLGNALVHCAVKTFTKSVSQATYSCFIIDRYICRSSETSAEENIIR